MHYANLHTPYILAADSRLDSVMPSDERRRIRERKDGRSNIENDGDGFGKQVGNKKMKLLEQIRGSASEKERQDFESIT